MNCTQCKGYSLEPVELEPGLVAANCYKCEGVLLPLLNYQFWSSAQAEELPKELDLDQIEDNKHAVICPKCQRFMLKYRIDIDQANRLDVCANCSEIWLDKGEWDLLKALGVHDKLPHIATSKWQKQLTEQLLKDRQEERHKDILGEAVFYKAADFKMWLDQQQQKDDIVNYLKN